MADRQTCRKYSKAGQENQLGLKEAYAVLQREFLELKKAYIGNEQQLVETQEQYLFLQQSYQDLQRNSQDQQAKLLEKLEKSYDAFNEKFMRVEELEEKLNKRNENVEKTKEQNEDKVKSASLQLHDQRNQLNSQRQLFHEAVEKCLSKVGLSLVTVYDHFEIQILDHKKLRQLAGFPEKGNGNCNDSTANGEKIVHLEQANAFLQQTLLLLKERSENQQEELSRTSKMLQKKTEESSSMKSDKGTILVERKAFERIVNGLSDMSDFVVELKKTIFDQNSWIEMLRGALNEYKTPQSSKQGTTKTSVGIAPSLKNKLPSMSTARRPDTSSCKQNSNNVSKNPSKIQKKNARQKKKPRDNRSGAVGGNTGRSSDSETIPSSFSQSAAKSDDKELQEFPDYVVVPSRQRSITEYAKTSDSDIYLLKSLSLHQVDSKVPMNMEPKSLQHELFQMSNSSISDRKSCERFETDSEGYFSLGFTGDSSTVGVVAPTQDMCPMCNLIFEPNCDLKKRRSHINSHFED